VKWGAIGEQAGRAADRFRGSGEEGAHQSHPSAAMRVDDWGTDDCGRRSGRWSRSLGHRATPPHQGEARGGGGGVGRWTKGTIDGGALDGHDDVLHRGLLAKDGAMARGGPRRTRTSARRCLGNGLRWCISAVAATGAGRGVVHRAESKSDDVEVKREMLSPLSLALLLKVVETSGESRNNGGNRECRQ
jgi:hypothetical protein